MMPLRILMLTAQYMPDVYGGAEKQCSRVAKELSLRGHKVTILTSAQKSHALDDDDASIRVKRIYTGFPPDLLGRWLFFSVYWWCATIWWSLINRHDFDVIHCHQGKFGAFVGCCIGKLTGKSVLVKIGNSEHHMDLLCLKRKKFLGPLLTKFILWSNPTFVAITDVIANNLKAFGCKNVITIHNGVDVSLLDQVIKNRSLRGHNGTSEDTINLFYHGRITEIKRVNVLLDAFCLAVKHNPQLRLHILGDGDCLEAIKKHARVLSLMDWVTFYGAVESVVEFVDRFDVFVNASEAEGFSNSLLEALLLGKVMVSTPVSGACDAILSGRNGVVSKDFDAEALAHAILSAVDLFQGNKHDAFDVSTSFIDEKFQMPKIIDQYEALYQRMTRINSGF